MSKLKKKKAVQVAPLTLTQVSTLAGVSRQAVHKAITNKRLAATRDANDDWLIDREHGQRFAEAQKARRLIAKRRARHLVAKLERRLASLKSKR